MFLNSVSHILRLSDKLSVAVENGAVSRRDGGWKHTYTSLKRTADASGADAARPRAILEPNVSKSLTSVKDHPVKSEVNIYTPTKAAAPVVSHRPAISGSICIQHFTLYFRLFSSCVLPFSCK